MVANNDDNIIKENIHIMNVYSKMGYNCEKFIPTSIKNNIDIRAMIILNAVDIDIRKFFTSLEDPIFKEAQSSIEYENLIQKYSDNLDLEDDNTLAPELKEGLKIFSQDGNLAILKNIINSTKNNIEITMDSWEFADIKDKIRNLYNINVNLFLLEDIFNCLEKFFIKSKTYQNYFILTREWLETFFIKIYEIREEFEKMFDLKIVAEKPLI